VSNNISGEGQIIQSTSSTTTRLTGDVTSTGGLTINNGTLFIGDGGATGSYNGATVISNGATFAFGRSNAYTHSGTISGAGALSKTGAGDVTMTASNSYSGTTGLFGGALVAGHANALGTGDIVFNSAGGGGTLRYTAASAGADWASRIKSSTAAIRLDTASNNVNLSGIIDTSNVAGLVKSGAGILTLGGANTYTGSTTINGGTLLVNGSLLSTNAVVLTGATLGGSGSLQAVNLQGGSLSPGNSPGLLTMTSLNANNGNFVFELGAPTSRGVTYDAVNVSGLLSLGANTTWQFQIYNGYAFKLNDTYDLFNWGTLDASTLDTNTLLTALPDLNTASTDLKWSVDSFTIDGTVMVIPEPSPTTLFILGSTLLIALKSFRRKL
jgi:fibronectin-binding autotransporter adhesin